jgi:hypothetical protein
MGLHEEVEKRRSPAFAPAIPECAYDRDCDEAVNLEDE